MLDLVVVHQDIRYELAVVVHHGATLQVGRQAGRQAGRRAGRAEGRGHAHNSWHASNRRHAHRIGGMPAVCMP